MVSKRIRAAKKAYERRDIEESRKAHAKELIEEDVHRKEEGRYIGDLVYGGLDGIVTTFAVVSGVAGASLAPAIVLILGFANVFADGISMAIGNYLGAKSELEYARSERQREEWEVENEPEEEVEEVRSIYERKGFKGEMLERVVEMVTSDKRLWVDTMMVEELNIMPEEKSPVKSALATFAAFLVAGAVPLASYVLSYFSPLFKANTFLTTAVLTVTTIFVIGSARVYVTGKRWWEGGLEMMLVGGLAAAVAYSVGFLLRGLA